MISDRKAERRGRAVLRRARWRALEPVVAFAALVVATALVAASTVCLCIGVVTGDRGLKIRSLTVGYPAIVVWALALLWLRGIAHRKEVDR